MGQSYFELSAIPVIRGPTHFRAHNSSDLTCTHPGHNQGPLPTIEKGEPKGMCNSLKTDIQYFGVVPTCSFPEL